MTNIIENKGIRIDGTIAELFLYNEKIEIDRYIFEVFDIFKKSPTIPGITLFRNNSLTGFLPRLKFFELMSKSYMLEMYNKRPIEKFYNDCPFGNFLILPNYTLIIKATEIALLRSEKEVNDPIIVDSGNGNYQILDIRDLLLAQTQIHMLTMESLKSANSFKDDVLQMAAHDLKNPLNAILGYSDLIMENPYEIDDIEEYTRLIHTASIQMLEIISDFLRGASYESNKLKISKDLTDLEKITRNVTSNFHNMAQKKEQKIKLDINSETPYIFLADKIKVTEAIENIISNAIKYTPRNKEIEISLEKENDFLKLSIKDQGPGFTDKDREKIFGKFEKLSARPTDGESSTGLGLYIVKQIMDLHEGNIIMQSKPGNGSLFVLEFPIGNIN
ncbi:MAG: ATP-binding protein [Ignavibacteriaceae bacterium]